MRCEKLLNPLFISFVRSGLQEVLDIETPTLPRQGSLRVRGVYRTKKNVNDPVIFDPHDQM